MKHKGTMGIKERIPDELQEEMKLYFTSYDEDDIYLTNQPDSSKIGMSFHFKLHLNLVWLIYVYL